ncbi:MAG: phage integrase N-terminal SAM-like domain-containing protein [bacterium]
MYHFGGKTHPTRLGQSEVERFLSHLASGGQLSASIQRQALNAIVFLSRNVLDRPQHTKLLLPVLSDNKSLPPCALRQRFSGY